MDDGILASTPEVIDYMFKLSSYSKYRLLYCNWYVNDVEYRLVKIWRSVSEEFDSSVVFSGNIRNKSELKNLLKQLRIDAE